MLNFVPQFKEVVVCDKRVSRHNRSKTVRRVKPALTDGTNGRQRWQNVRGLVQCSPHSKHKYESGDENTYFIVFMPASLSH